MCKIPLSFQAPFAKPSPSMWRSCAVALSALVEISCPSRKCVEFSVRRHGVYRKVFDAIVSLVAVNVMNYLVAFKRPSKMLFHNLTVNSYLPPRSRLAKYQIPFIQIWKSFVSRRPISGPRHRTTRDRAELRSCPTWLYRKRDSTVLTDSVNRLSDSGKLAGFAAITTATGLCLVREVMKLFVAICTPAALFVSWHRLAAFHRAVLETPCVRRANVDNPATYLTRHFHLSPRCVVGNLTRKVYAMRFNASSASAT
jgi:hypothetical protein